MSTTIKPKEGVIYECYKGFTDRYGDYCRVGQKFKWDNENDDYTITGDYVFEKASGRGVNIAVPTDKFQAHFIPVQGTFEEEKFKIGDKVKIKEDSQFYNQGIANPKDRVGTIKSTTERLLPIAVQWDENIWNTYSKGDLELAKEESYIDVTEKITNMTIQAITVSSEEQIRELATISFLKDQLEAAFPELFTTHKVGNRYKHEDGNRYILIGGRVSNQVALVNLKTGEMESYKVEVADRNKITESEFKQLCLDTNRLTLIKERQ